MLVVVFTHTFPLECSLESGWVVHVSAALGPLSPTLCSPQGGWCE